MILPLLPLSSLTESYLVWIFSFPPPTDLAGKILLNGLIHSVQKLWRINIIASKNGSAFKLHILERCFYKLATFALKLLTMSQYIHTRSKFHHLIHELYPTNSIPQILIYFKNLYTTRRLIYFFLLS